MAEIRQTGTPPAEEAEPEEQPAVPAVGALFPIVGIGASAGGLAAFEQFFSTMPPDKDCGMAIVFVQHLARDHKSLLSDLIRRYTRMEVFEVSEGMIVKPNCAYIIPPNRDMALSNGALLLQEPSLARGIRLPIDHFFRSLAQDQHERAICIVLSGTGSDGALGVKAVKGEGGMVMAQTPESTEYDGMPRSAIATGAVDFVLSPQEMPAKLFAYVTHAFGAMQPQAAAQRGQQHDVLDRILLLLRSLTGHDFSQYKRNTVIRRVERRMAVHQIDDLDGYLRYMQLTRGEADALFRELLIGVTSFFRDTEIFDDIQRVVIPQLFAGKSAGSVIRVWVPGCSTGEEAYSLAILLREHMEEIKVNFKVQIFATDIDREAIEFARAGVYPSNIVADISPERLAQFFDPEDAEGHTYRIHKIIRDMLIFSEHDLIKNPPFSKLDLISCRNLLIYMGADLQKKLMPLFHYALNLDGVLVLGSSESIGDFINLFSPIERKSRIYKRLPHEFGRLSRTIPGFFERSSGSEGIAKLGGVARLDPKLPLQGIVERAILQHYSPVGALVGARGEILYLLGRTGRYLEQPPGEASLNIFRMAREGLRGDLTIALHRAISTGLQAQHSGSLMKGEPGGSKFNLTVAPVAAEADGLIPDGLFLVLIDEEKERDPNLLVEDALDKADDNAGVSSDINEYILKLKQELRAKEEYLQTTNEELETSNEELRSAHEEMQSVNEEMQSTNEELETSREELQSVNEELATVNNELESKVVDLSRSNNDMKNLLSGTGIGTIFVDHNLRILRFTPTVSTLINLIDSDVGRPLSQIRSNLKDYDGLDSDIKEVLEHLAPKELEVETLSGEWYLLRIRPYRTLENVIEGAVITFTEITLTKKTQAVIRDSEALRRLAVVVRDTRDAILVLDMAGLILAWNPGAQRLYGWSEAEALTMNVRDLMPEAGREQAFAAMVQQCQSGLLEPLRQVRIAKNGGMVEVSLIAAALVNEAGEMYAIATTGRRVVE